MTDTIENIRIKAYITFHFPQRYAFPPKISSLSVGKTDLLSYICAVLRKSVYLRFGFDMLSAVSNKNAKT